METAKANGIEPYQYLRLLFTELPKAQTVEDVEALLPYAANPADTENVKSAVA
ncbi:MAG: transposase domain-containing protein [Gammaproteobacteria bacterium]|nr:transposase domain-containing protein [Gammaproteobacteria bacterium]